MKDLETEFSLLTPNLVSEEAKVRVWFTLKNQQYKRPAQQIPGLNLGYNTSEKKEEVAENRLLLSDSLNLDSDWIAYADQVHGTRVRSVTGGGTYPETDGLITRVPGLTLAIQVADCAAVLLWDPQNRVIGALHAGWRGASGEIVTLGVEKMIAEGADLGNIKAYVSPCISKKNFEVGHEVAEQFRDEFVDYNSFSKPHVDLKDVLKNQLISNKINAANIEINDKCTVADEDQFYSFRREGKKSGRMLALIQIQE